MHWIVQNFSLIPALPLMLAVGVGVLTHTVGAERRQTVAHGASRGISGRDDISPGGATE